MGENKDHEFCLRCGRRLKNPIAREKGYGIVCERKMKFDRRKLFKLMSSDEKEKDDNLQSS